MGEEGGEVSDPLMLKFEYAQNRLSLNTGTQVA